MAIDTRRMNHTSAEGRIKSNAKMQAFPVPKQLATPTDLSEDQVKAITEAVNPIIADALALYVKTKNFHWHLAGSHFRDYHLLFDEQADSLIEAVDPLAERIRKIGGTTVRSISHISQLQTIEDDNDAYVPPEEMVQALLDDNLHIAKVQRAAMELCEEKRDYTTSNLLQEIQDQTERRIWFLYEILQGGEHVA